MFCGVEVSMRLLIFFVNEFPHIFLEDMKKPALGGLNAAFWMV